MTKEIRDWGWWRVLWHFDKNCKLKELVVHPNSRLSWQQHKYRSEIWFVRKGTATIYHSMDREGIKDVFKVTKTERQTQKILKYQWHCLANETDEILSIVETQFGDDCRESDIIRKDLPQGNYLYSD
jgi:mannose-6-phosphate isomerase